MDSVTPLAPSSRALESERPLVPAAWTLLLFALPVVVALGITTWSGMDAAREAASSLAREQGDALARPIRTRLRREELELPPSAALSEFVEGRDEGDGEGAHYVVVLDPAGQHTVSAGASRIGAERVRELLLAQGSGYLLETDQVALIVKRLIPSAAVRARYPEENVPPELAPRVAIEFVPLAARQLERTALRTLAAGASAILLLVLTSAFLARLLRRRASLEQALASKRQLAALGEMSVVLAHEIRNPLASLKGHAQLLAESLDDKSAEHRKVERIVTEAVRLEELCANLLDFVRSAQVSPEPTELGGLFASCADEARGVDAQAGEFRLILAGAPARWDLDPLRIRHVLVNLLRNAAQASPPGAPIELEARRVPGGLEILVRDQGPGIPVGEEARVFEPFHTTRTRGTGLGLAVARRVVELHGGTIEARTRSGGGAELRVTLPGSER